jgi:hypothetical protein
LVELWKQSDLTVPSNAHSVARRRTPVPIALDF